MRRLHSGHGRCEPRQRTGATNCRCSNAGTAGGHARGARRDSLRQRAQHLFATFHQSCAPTPGQDQKLPFMIPLALGLLSSQGTPVPLQIEGEPEARGLNHTLC
ncbi:MAG: DUF3458 domain-containing protein [Burkholderiaceae bacterium]